MGFFNLCIATGLGEGKLNSNWQRMGSARIILPKTHYMSNTPTAEPGYETSKTVRIKIDSTRLELSLLILFFMTKIRMLLQTSHTDILTENLVYIFKKWPNLHLSESQVLQYFDNVWYKLTAPDAFAKVMKIMNYAG